MATSLFEGEADEAATAAVGVAMDSVEEVADTKERISTRIITADEVVTKGIPTVQTIITGEVATKDTITTPTTTIGEAEAAAEETGATILIEPITAKTTGDVVVAMIPVRNYHSFLCFSY